MIIGIPKEILHNERRVAALPETVEEYVNMGFQVLVQSSAGEGAFHFDEDYQKSGATVVPDARTVFEKSDVILKVKQLWFNEKEGQHEVDMMREKTMLVTFLHPAAPINHKTIKMLAARKITSFTMDDIPRSSRAQQMDALTSMSTITGYKSVLMAANSFPKFIPVIGTAIGLVKAAKFLVIGIGVVGLQAIATAKRLGGSIKAVDTREDARKAADSLGAKVVGFEVPSELAIEEGGYAKTLPAAWIEKEREALVPHVEEADIIILSALVHGEVAPTLITEDMVRKMKPGSVIMDVSVDQGGNCALTEGGMEVVKHGVTLGGMWNIPGSMPVHASWLYANNMLHYMKNLFKKGIDKPDLTDEIVRQSLVTHEGAIVHAGTLKAMKQAEEAAASGKE
ncbi:MAG: NAD(P) transhydrogenase subunit alpha [Pirellulales bacterium]|nr:NAD(P) transhydrogenase subunit alpha [Pirellulales bacterium]